MKIGDLIKWSNPWGYTKDIMPYKNDLGVIVKEDHGDFHVAWQYGDITLEAPDDLERIAK